MLDLLRGHTDTAARLVELAVAASERAGLADAWMVIESMKGYAAVQAGDAATCAVVAAECEEFATAEGVPVVCAEASFLWLAAGQPERARALVRTFHGRVLHELPRDVNWLRRSSACWRRPSAPATPRSSRGPLTCSPRTPDGPSSTRALSCSTASSTTRFPEQRPFSVMWRPPADWRQSPCDLRTYRGPLVARPARGLASAAGRHTSGGTCDGAGDTTAGSGRIWLVGPAAPLCRFVRCAASVTCGDCCAGPVDPCRQSIWYRRQRRRDATRAR